MLRIETRPGLHLLTLDRSSHGNALSAELVEALMEAVGRATEDPGVHTLAIAGEGRHLCTGFDLSSLEASSDGDLVARLLRIEMLLAMLWHAPIRTAAIATGKTWGAGADLFAACDIRIAAAQSGFRFPGAGFGIVLGSRRLAERVGTDRARRWIETGAELDANEALASGLATHLGEPTAAASKALGWARLEHLAPPPAIDRTTAAAMRAATRADHRDSDLAALARSAVRPGLRDRILAYRQRLGDAASRSQSR